MLHLAISLATCVATELRDKLHSITAPLKARNFVATQVANEIARCNTPSILSHATFLLQEALHKVESGNTFRNDCRNAATHFLNIAHCNITLATCLAIFLLGSQ